MFRVLGLGFSVRVLGLGFGASGFRVRVEYLRF